MKKHEKDERLNATEIMLIIAMATNLLLQAFQLVFLLKILPSLLSR